MKLTHRWKVTWVTPNGVQVSTDQLTEKDARFLELLLESYTLMKNVEVKKVV